MNRQINNRIKFFITSVVLLIVVTISFSFAYIRGGSTNNESISTVALTGGNITVRYTNNSSDIIAMDIVPNYEVTKSFTITSDFGDRDYYTYGVWYTVAIVLDKNDFDDNSIVYSISADNTSSSDGLLIPNRENIGIPNSANSNRVIVGSGKLYGNNVSHTYILKISYPYRKSDQSHEIGSEFKAHIDIISSELIKATFNLDGGSFNNLDLNNNSLSIPANSIVGIPVPNKEGYAFAGWEVISGDVSANNNVISTNDSDISLRALWIKSIFNFNYTGGEQQFIAEYSGYYRLEVWGAQGGSVNADTSIGGYGGYSKANVYLNKETNLYINVGGIGISSTSKTAVKIDGGYNGGGSAFGATDKYVSSGGGATHISKISGLLNSLSGDWDNIYIVSGGGGGSAYQESGKYGSGGSGGGIIGNPGTRSTGSSTIGTGGNQLTGGTGTVAGDFGLGGSSTSNGTAGGGGFYGGGAGQYYVGGGGGSGYIGNSLLNDKYMYCYNCDTSDVENTKTFSTSCAEETPTENCAKIGNGYARITYLHS